MKTKNKFRTIAGFLVVLTLIAFSFSCKKMYDNIKPYAEETVYPQRYDTIAAKIGYERVEIDLIKAGRIPSSQIRMGKSKKTIVEYDNQKIVIDSLVSWLNIKGLKQSKLYRFKVYTIDEFENKSVPQQIAVIPFTESDVKNLVIASPRIMASPNAMVIDWTSSLSSILLTYKSLSFEYKDKTGKVITGTRGASPRIFAANLNPGSTVAMKLAYNVVPKVGGQEIADSITYTQTLDITLPTGETTFNPTERDILVANGITTFNANVAAGIKKLTFPIHTNSLQDLFYFSNVTELDLTGGELFNLKTLDYNRNAVVKTIGGGKFQPFIRHVSAISNANAQAMLDLLDLGIIKKIKYIPNSLGIDELLKRYEDKNIIEWVTPPDESLIPMNFFLDGKIQDNAWATDIVNPATDYPAGANILNPLKVTLKASSASFVFTLPKEYRFNIATYKYLKFKVYAPDKSKFTGSYSAFQKLWPRFMNYMWAFSSESTFGQEYWDLDRNATPIPDSDLMKWKDVTIDLSSAKDKHNRVIVINIGGEPGGTFSPPENIVYYFANFRFSK